MTDAILGTSSLTLDLFFKYLALGIAIFSPMSVLVWTLLERRVRSVDHHQDSQQSTISTREQLAEWHNPNRIPKLG